MEENKEKLQTIAILVDNASGVLSLVSRLFSRKGYNIESLAVGTTENPEVSRITVDLFASDERVELLKNQLGKLLQVHAIKILNRKNSILRELMLVKIKVDSGEKRNEVIGLANIFKANIIDVSINTLTLAIINNSEDMRGIENILKNFEIIELARTGGIALERGIITINDETKDKSEFNYGKNIL